MVDISKIMNKIKSWKYGPRTGAVQTLLSSKLLFISIDPSHMFDQWTFLSIPWFSKKKHKSQQKMEVSIVLWGYIPITGKSVRNGWWKKGGVSGHDFRSNNSPLISHHFPLVIHGLTIIWLVVWLPCFIFPYIGNVIIPIDFHIFQRGSNHQPDWLTISFPSCIARSSSERSLQAAGESLRRDRARSVLAPGGILSDRWLVICGRCNWCGWLMSGMLGGFSDFRSR